MAKILMSVNNLTDLPDVDGYVLGYEKYSFFASHYFSYDEIKDFDKKDKIFLLLNSLLHEDNLPSFILELEKLIKLDINYIVSDFGVLNLLLERVDPCRIIYYPYTLICNLQEYETYHDLFKVSVGISNELKFNDLKKYQDYSLITIYGYTPIYESHRKILSLYEKYHHLSLQSKDLYVKEDSRPLEKYHILENEYGTIIFSKEPIDLIDKRDELKSAQYLFIDTIYLSEEEIKNIIKRLKDE